jgi:hypothetical protein
MSNQENELEHELNEIWRECERLCSLGALAPMDQWNQLQTRRLGLERRLGAIRGEECADEVGLDDVPVSLRGETYLLGQGRTSIVLGMTPDAKIGTAPTIALVFWDCFDSRLDTINDEVSEAHPLHGHGLGVTGLFIVRNSRWRRDMMGIQLTHLGFAQREWDRVEHYALRTKQGGFSFLSTGFTWRFVERSMEDIRREFEELRGPISMKLRPGF